MKKDEPMRNINPFGLRLQPDLKSRIEASAAYNHRSINAEIVARLEASFGPAPMVVLVDEHHRSQSPSPERALELIEQLKGEIVGLTAQPKE